MTKITDEMVAGHKIDELNIVDFNKEGTAMPEDGIFAREDWLKDAKNQDIAARFFLTPARDHLHHVRARFFGAPFTCIDAFLERFGPQRNSIRRSSRPRDVGFDGGVCHGPEGFVARFDAQVGLSAECSHFVAALQSDTAGAIGQDVVNASGVLSPIEEPATSKKHMN